MSKGPAPSPTTLPPPNFTVYAENFSRNDESLRLIGEFATAEAAQAFAEARVTADLTTYSRPGQLAEETLNQWLRFGEDVYLVPDAVTAPFSAVEFARTIVERIMIV